MKKRIVCLTLALMMCGTQVVSVSASREDDLREEQAWTSQQLDATYARMSALWDQKQQLLHRHLMMVIMILPSMMKKEMQ